MAENLQIDEILNQKRIGDVITKAFAIFFFPLGLILLIIRCFIGVHAFLIACLLRKSNRIRSIVMRFMCCVLGIVVRKFGERDESAQVLVSNHISILDHLAIDLISPCFLPSIWDIPTVIRWCFGYVDLGASRGRSELVQNAKKLLAETRGQPILAFPEGEITNGKRALLKFSTWAFEISDVVQPISITVSRPVPWNFSVSRIAASWLADLVLFFAIPATFINVEYLPKLTRNEDESIDEFALRTAQTIATHLKIEVSNFEPRDVAEATKRWKRDQFERRNQAGNSLSSGSSGNRLQNDRQLDECAMRIKQSHPSFHLSLIREDLQKTRNQAATITNLKLGKIPKDLNPNLDGKINLDPSSWKSIFSSRKWQMIEENRSKYLQKDGAFVATYLYDLYHSYVNRNYDFENFVEQLVNIDWEKIIRRSVFSGKCLIDLLKIIIKIRKGVE
ncbi:unnamed protein product [Caenorhabditis angaria]|uniref:CUE domain-containing protein n=1 Tax=Caenorhabditis angaria TaxID=860376 RepID=A0A9P1IH49_9PELO|nr:unnamed protein product [Caenorhabditis angaria]